MEINRTKRGWPIQHKFKDSHTGYVFLVLAFTLNPLSGILHCHWNRSTKSIWWGMRQPDQFRIKKNIPEKCPKSLVSESFTAPFFSLFFCARIFYSLVIPHIVNSYVIKMHLRKRNEVNNTISGLHIAGTTESWNVE